MTITVEDHEHRLYLPALSCSLPKEMADCVYEKWTDLGEGGVAIRYRFGEICLADIFVYDADCEVLEDGVNLEVFEYFSICKAGIESLRQDKARLITEGIYAVYEFPEEPQFYCAVFETPSSESDKPSTLTHLFVRSVQGCFFKIRLSHFALHQSAATRATLAFVGELVTIFKARA